MTLKSAFKLSSIAACLSQIRVADKQDVQIDWQYVIGIIDQALSIVIKQDVQIGNFVIKSSQL